MFCRRLDPRGPIAINRQVSKETKGKARWTPPSHCGPSAPHPIVNHSTPPVGKQEFAVRKTKSRHTCRTAELRMCPAPGCALRARVRACVRVCTHTHTHSHIKSFIPHGNPERYVGFIASLPTEKTEAHRLIKALVVHTAGKSQPLLECADLRPTGDAMKGLHIFVLGFPVCP